MYIKHRHKQPTTPCTTKIRRVVIKINGEMTAAEFCSFILQSYLVEQRYDLLNAVIHEDISEIGTGAHEMCRNSDAFASAMFRSQWCNLVVYAILTSSTTQLAQAKFYLLK